MPEDGGTGMGERFYPPGWEQDGQRWDGGSWQPVAPSLAPSAPTAPAAFRSFPPPSGPELGGAAPVPAAQPAYAAAPPPSLAAAPPPAAYPPAPARPSVFDPTAQALSFSPVPAAAAPVLRAAGPSATAAAAPWFVIGVVVALGVSAAGIWVIRNGGAGIIWYGGFFVAFSLWRRAYAAYQEALAVGGRGMSASAGAVAAVLVLACVGGGVMLMNARVHMNDPQTVPLSAQTVGSCFHADLGAAVDGRTTVAPVACSDGSANFKAIAERPDRTMCPPESAAGFRNDYGTYLCLARL